MKFVCEKYLAKSELGAFEDVPHEATDSCKVVPVEVVEDPDNVELKARVENFPLARRQYEAYLYVFQQLRLYNEELHRDNPNGEHHKRIRDILISSLFPQQVSKAISG